MTPEERARLMKRYETGQGVLVAALDTVPAGSLDFAPPGEWSARKIIHHVVDAEVLRSAQLRTLLGGRRVTNRSVRPGPLLEQYQRPLESSLDLFRAAVESNLALLRCLAEDEWARPGPNRQSGTFSIKDWLERAAGHAHEHAEQLRKLAADA